jgi:hypothetical protein
MLKVEKLSSNLEGVPSLAVWPAQLMFSRLTADNDMLKNIVPRSIIIISEKMPPVNVLNWGSC